MIDCITHWIIIECDEDEHKYYDSEDNQKREEEIKEDLGTKPIIMICFNPDSYLEQNQRKSGCFQKTTGGKLILDEDEWNRRIEVLLKTIDDNLYKIEMEWMKIELYYSTY